MPEAGGRETEAPEVPEREPLWRRAVAAGVLVSMVASLSPGLVGWVLTALRPPAVETPRRAF